MLDTVRKPQKPNTINKYNREGKILHPDLSCIYKLVDQYAPVILLLHFLAGIELPVQ